MRITGMCITLPTGDIITTKVEHNLCIYYWHTLHVLSTWMLAFHGDLRASDSWNLTKQWYINHRMCDQPCNRLSLLRSLTIKPCVQNFDWSESPILSSISHITWSGQGLNLYTFHYCCPRFPHTNMTTSQARLTYQGYIIVAHDKYLSLLFSDFYVIYTYM